MSGRGFRRLFRLRRDIRADLDREIRFHLESRKAEYIENGMSEGEAERRAASDFGPHSTFIRQAKREDSKSMVLRSLAGFVDSVLQDVGFGVRGLIRYPGYSVAAIATIAISVGATSAVYSVVDNVVLRPLKYRDPSRIVTLWATRPQAQARYPMSYPDFRDWRDQSAAVQSMSLLRGAGLNIEISGEVESITAALVTEGFAGALGARLSLGSDAGLSSPSPDAPVVVLKYDAWTSRFGSDSSIVGKPVVLSGKTYVVGGVFAPEVTYPAWADVFIPLTEEIVASEGINARDFRVDHRVIGRLAPGATLESAQAELDAVALRLAQSYPDTNEDWGVRVIALADVMVGDSRTQLFALLGAVVVLLLIGCANVATLSVARTLNRGNEIGVRAALGAGRGRIVRQLLTESAIIAAVGTGAGIVLASMGLAAFLRTGVPGLPRATEVAVDERVVLISSTLGIVVALAFGIWPAIQGARFRLSSIARGMRGADRLGWYRSSMTVVQVALTIVLISGAALLFRSFSALQAVDPGFDMTDLVTLRINPPAEFDSRPAPRRELYAQIRDAVAALPAVRAAGLVNHMPLDGRGVLSPIATQRVTVDDGLIVWFKTADRSFFSAIGNPVLEGNLDGFGSDPGVVVNEALASSLFPDGGAVGSAVTVFRQVASDPGIGEPITLPILAIVGNTLRTIRENPPESIVFVSLSEQVWPNMALVVRLQNGTDDVFSQIATAVHTVDRRIPVSGITTVESFAAGSVARERFLKNLSGVFSIVALALAVIGTYGVLAFYVRRRARDIGIRMALGAERRSVITMVVGRGALLVTLGVLIGIPGAIFSTRFIQSMLFGTDSGDPTAFIAAAIILLVSGIVATALPARNAAATDPVEVLKE